MGSEKKFENHLAYEVPVQSPELWELIRGLIAEGKIPAGRRYTIRTSHLDDYGNPFHPFFTMRAERVGE